MMHACDDHKTCVVEALKKADAICRDKSLRFTALRRKVLAMIWENHRPAKAYDILDKLKESNASAKPPTVYRTLDFLLENGLIHKLDSLNAYVGCLHPLEHDECYFLICNKCGETKECCNGNLDQVITETAKKNKFHPVQTTLEIKGECQQCLQKK